MSDLDAIRRVLAIIANHAVAAHASPYDRHVAVTAIARARTLVENTPIDPDDAREPEHQILDALTALHSTYHDPDGEYTNGKGVLGSLIDDVALVLSHDKPK